VRRECGAVLVLFLLVLSAFSGLASEPDGRIAFRYAWVSVADAPKDEVRRLRLSITPLVPITDARLDASAPSGAPTFLKTWAAGGIALDGLAVGAPTVLELEVIEPKVGGEILTFSVRGLSDGVPVRESVGVPVGTPGVTPQIRNGAAEFPAARDGTQP
jgi:hypothetical protein